MKRRFIFAKRRFVSSTSHSVLSKVHYQLYYRQLKPTKESLLYVESLKDIRRYVKTEKFVAQTLSHFGKILDCFVGCNTRSNARQNPNHRFARIFSLAQSFFVGIERTIAAFAVWKVKKSDLSASCTYRTVNKRLAKYYKVEKTEVYVNNSDGVMSEISGLGTALVVWDPDSVSDGDVVRLGDRK